MCDIALVEFNGWMAGVLEYGDQPPAGQALCDAYLDEYWLYMDHLCDAACA